MEYTSGTITFYNNLKGFGFITCPDGKQFFFHISRFAKGESPVLEGQVEFIIAPAIAVGKKPQAVSVHYRQSAYDALANKPAAAIKTLAGEDATSVGGAK